MLYRHMFLTTLYAGMLLIAGCQQELLDTERATPTPDPPKVKKAPRADESRFAVGGMTCVSCANIIREAVLEDPRVAGATVLFADEQLHVIWKPGVQPDEDTLVERVEQLGYTLALERATVRAPSATSPNASRAIAPLPEG
ncbi:MAG: heavy metal-associated domain-containing protein [Myxococcota bacterium]